MPPTEGLTDGKAAIPLYQQVIDIIKNEINSGAYKAGARIPNEFELAESYKVGRVTVRRAIEELVQQGYLTKRQGKGTFELRPESWPSLLEANTRTLSIAVSETPPG